MTYCKCKGCSSVDIVGCVRGCSSVHVHVAVHVRGCSSVDIVHVRGCSSVDITACKGMQ